MLQPQLGSPLPQSSSPLPDVLLSSTLSALGGSSGAPVPPNSVDWKGKGHARSRGLQFYLRQLKQ